jgi:hypothetical protein
MPIKNYTTSVPANRSINEITTSLVKHGATDVLMSYEEGTGRIAALKFKIVVRGQPVGFALPVSWRRFQECLRQQGVKKYRDEDYVYRVAWRCLRDWVLAQMALFETEMVELPQVFLPFAVAKNEKTLYENVIDGQLLLGNGKTP